MTDTETDAPAGSDDPIKTEAQPSDEQSAVEVESTGQAAPPETAPAAEIAPEPMSEPLSEPITEPITEPIAEPIAESITEPVAESLTEPMTEPITEAAAEPVGEAPVAADETVSEAAATPSPDAAGDPASDVAGDPPAAEAAPAAAGEERAKSGKPSSGGGRGRPRRQLAELVVGEKLQGKVVGLSKFGAFVDIGATTDGLVHLTELPGKRVRTAEEAVSSGDSVEVFVKDVDIEKGRISLSMRAPSERPLGGLAVGDILTGRVTTITKYGAFVDIGSETEGLVHISEMSSGFVSRPEDVVQAGAEIEVRVKELDLDRKRISLSMVGTAGDSAAQAQAEQRPRGGQQAREREEEVYVPEEPAERMPTVVELALRRAMGEDVDGDDGDRGKGRGDKGKKAAQREMTDVYAKMLSDYRESKGES